MNWNKKLVVAVAAMASGLTALGGVKYFDSIEARAGQAINTEIGANGSLVIECEMEWLSTPKNGCVIGASSANGSSRTYAIYCNANYCWSIGYSSRTISNGVAVKPNTRHHVVSTVNSEIRSCVVDDVEVVKETTSEAVKNDGFLYVFDACNSAGLANGTTVQARLYWLKIRKFNESTGEMELVRDFRPAKVNNRYGLYDAVSERLFAAIPSTGAFGPDSVSPRQKSADVTYFDCLCASANGSVVDASPIIDTEVIGRDGIQVEGEIAWNSVQEDKCFVGSRKDSSRFYVIYSYSAWAMGNGDNLYGDKVTYVPGQKYHVVSTITNGVSTCVVDGKEVVYDKRSTKVDTERPLYIFANNNGAKTEAEIKGGRCAPASGRIWWLKIRELDKATGEFKLLRYFRPACKDGEYGLYDEVSGRLFTAVPGAPQFSRESVIASCTKPISAPKPKSYLEFIEIPCGAVVDTDVRARSGLETEVDFTPYANCGNSSMLCTAKGSSGSDFVAAQMIKHGYSYVNAVQPADATLASAIRDKRKRIRTRLFAGEQWIAVNGVRTAQGSVAEPVNTDTNLMIFGDRTWEIGETVASDAFIGRFYGCRIWEQDEAAGLKLVRDFRPCLCDESIGGFGGLPAVYDEVSGRYFPVRTPSSLVSTRTPNPCVSAVVPGPRVMAGPQRRVEYLESDGAQVIFTGVHAKNDLKVEAKVEWLEVPGDAGMLCARGYLSDTRCYLLYSYSPTGWIECWKTWDTTSSVKIQQDKVCEVDVIFEDGLQKVTVDGVVAVNKTSTGSMDGVTDLTLFGLNTAFAATKSFVKARVYSMKIWARDPEKGETEYRLVRDYVPCVNDGVPGLYDRVTGHLACEEKNLGCVGANGVVPGPTMKAGPYKPMGLKILFY